MVTLAMLLNGLCDDATHVFYGVNPTHTYHGIYLTDAHTICEPGMIYVGDSQSIYQLLLRGNLPENCALFAANGDETLLHSPRHNLPLVVTSLDLIPLYNKLFYTMEQCRSWHQKLTAASQNNLRNLLHSATQEFSCSVWFLSGTMQPISQSVQKGEEGLLALHREHAAAHNFPLPEELLNLLQQEENAPEIVISTRIDGYLFALLPIRHKREVLGYLFACSQNRKSIFHNMLLVLAGPVKDFLQSTTADPDMADSFQLLAVNFLGDTPDDTDAPDLRLRQLRNPPARFMRSLVIRPLTEDGRPLPVSALQQRRLYNEVRQLFPRDNVALLQDCVYVLLSDAVPNAPITVTENKDFIALLQRHHAYAMVTNPSQWLKGVRILYRQAFQLLPAAVAVRFPAETQTRCLRFDQYAPYYSIYLCQTAAQREMGVNDILYLCHASLLTIIRHDRAFNSNLYEVLFTYLMNDCSISETSRQLYMHRNTTINKLKKIQELIGDDLTNSYTRHQLMLSCMIIRYVEKYLCLSVELPLFEHQLLNK